jgi:malate dehydrogenase (oxaloacetate-decarboxylating)(NADP+)
MFTNILQGNLVAVITNGTAVFGLGDIGPEASKPVMEGRDCCLKFLLILMCLISKLVQKILKNSYRRLKYFTNFCGINLEDIKAPESFEIERRLVEELNIPVIR